VLPWNLIYNLIVLKHVTQEVKVVKTDAHNVLKEIVKMLMRNGVLKIVLVAFNVKLGNVDLSVT